MPVFLYATVGYYTIIMKEMGNIYMNINDYIRSEIIEKCVLNINK